MQSHSSPVILSGLRTSADMCMCVLRMHFGALTLDESSPCTLVLLSQPFDALDRFRSQGLGSEESTLKETVASAGITGQVAREKKEKNGDPSDQGLLVSVALVVSLLMVQGR